MFVFVSYFYIALYFIVIPQKPVCFLIRDTKGVDPDGRSGREELGEEGGKTIIRICFVRKKTIFNKMKKSGTLGLISKSINAHT